jgi:hypothetical protein
VDSSEVFTESIKGRLAYYIMTPIGESA